MRNVTTIVLVAFYFAHSTMVANAAERTSDVWGQIELKHGVVAVVGVPEGDAEGLIERAVRSELTYFVQVRDASLAKRLRELSAQTGLLGNRVYVELASTDEIHLSTNLADAAVVATEQKTSDKELMRILRPDGIAYVGSRSIVKPRPDGIDEWSHPYHGPDNNPQSKDQLVKGDFRTQFVGFPKFSPMPEQSVIAGGRIYKAMGHIAHKANQNEMLNTLLCINAYNGTILWRKPLPAGFMIHRNTMIASDDALYLGDDKSCKVIDGETGEVRAELTVPDDITDGPVWKWMAMSEGILYAMVGNKEVKVDTQRSTRRGLGHWPWGMWQGHEYADPKTAFGFGRTLVAVDLKTKDVLWYHRDKDFLDARAMCMNAKHIFCYSPNKKLACLDRVDGRLVWQQDDKELLEAIAPNQRAQHYTTGYATSCYAKCTDDHIFFAGPQRKQLVAASAHDGKLSWTFPVGNLQLVLRRDGIWAAGPQRTKGVKLDYETGKVLADFPARRACTRATGCADSIFYRASGGTVRVLTDSNSATHIAPMRPPCQDGVLVSNGHLYWGPWMCGCQLSLYGNIGLAPVVDGEVPAEPYADALWQAENLNEVASLNAHEHDWVSYQGGNDRDQTINVELPKKVKQAWSVPVSKDVLATAPVAAGGMVFVADRAGAVRGYSDAGRLLWQQFTGGPVYYPPAVAHDRVYVGSADGRVYAYAAKDGRPLWSFRVAPQDRRISVFGKLVSRWPVAGGVVVQDGKLYAAAGFTHYDGTYVVSLDAITGELAAKNTTSGVVAEDVNNGISMQGDLSIIGSELHFLAGGVYEIARYDLATLKCLNSPKQQVTSQFRTAFYPYYPAYGKFVSLQHECENGCELTHDASYEGSLFTNLSLLEPLPPGTTRPRKEVARWLTRRGKTPPKAVWSDKLNRRFTSFVVSGGQLLATGHPDLAPEQSFLACVNLKDGSDAWLEKLPADAVKGGSAVDHQGNIYLVLQNGQLVCYRPEK